MAISKANSEDGPSETSPLLTGSSSGKTQASSTNKTLGLFPNGTAEEVTGPANGGATAGGDEEAGEPEEVANALFEGLPEMAKKLPMLLPALGIGVRLIPDLRSVTVHCGAVCSMDEGDRSWTIMRAIGTQ